jgi:hypothetical protein
MSQTKVQITSASQNHATGKYLDMPWTARKNEKGAWKFKLKKELSPGAKANIAHQINLFIDTGEDK